MKRPRMFSHLLVRPVDQAGESQPGYWLRIAHANGLRRVQWMLSTGERWASGMARFCPRCLQAPNPFWRDEWLDPAGYWCSEHSTWLVDTCPSCGRRLQWGFMRFDACMCGHRWPGSATEDVPLRLVLAFGSGWVSVKEALRRWVHVDSTGAFVRALRSGALTVCAGPDSSALGQGLIPEEALLTWVASLLDPTRSELMLGEVATALGIKHDVVRDLIRVGLLKASVGQMNRRRCWRISQQEVENFRRRYVALAELTRESNVRSKDGFAWAREQQLNVITGPLVDGARQYFVRRPGCSLATAGASRLPITARDGGMR